MENSWPAGGWSARFDLEVLSFVQWGSWSHFPRSLFLCLVQELPAEPRPLPVWPGTPMLRLEGSVAPSVHPELSCPSCMHACGQASPSWSAGHWVPHGELGLLPPGPLFPCGEALGDLTRGPSYTGPARVCPPQRSTGFGEGAGGPGWAPQDLALAPLPVPWGLRPGRPKACIPGVLGGCRTTPTST